MFKRFAALAALVIVCGLAMGQDAKPAYVSKKGLTECVYPGISLDKAWPAAIKVFMTQEIKRGGKWRGVPVTLDKPSGVMFGTLVFGSGLTQWSCQLELLFEEQAQGTKVYCTVDVGNKQYRERAQKKFFDKMTELLYGLPATEKLK